MSVLHCEVPVHGSPYHQSNARHHQQHGQVQVGFEKDVGRDTVKLRREFNPIGIDTHEQGQQWNGKPQHEHRGVHGP